jgi:hypothetical protein
MTADSTSARSGETTRSRSASVLDGAICSSGTSSPVEGSLYWMRLWWVSSRSSSARTPVERSTSMIAQVQNAWSSSPGQVVTLAAAIGGQDVHGLPAGRGAGEGLPGDSERAARLSACCGSQDAGSSRVVLGGRADQDRQDGQALAGAGIHPRLHRRSSLRALISAVLTGLGAAHDAQRTGSSTAQHARSR